jgi:cell division septum initiation protein DivIVA
MAQEISIEDAFPTFQKRVHELFEENLLLRSQVDKLERQLAEATQGVDEPAPALPGPNLAAQPPFGGVDRG